MTSTIMIQTTGSTQVPETVHLGCALARSQGGPIVLVQMIPVTHPGWLGTEWAWAERTEADAQLAKACRVVADEYGVELETMQFPYSTLLDAIVQAADYLDAGFVFATLPAARAGWWHKWQVRRLERRLAARQRRLCLPGEPGDAARWTPSILVPAPQVTSR